MEGRRNGAYRAEIALIYRCVTPMLYGLKQAADATGRTKPTLLRAIQTGKISAKKNELREREIDPAELHRFFPPVTAGVTRTVTPDVESSGGLPVASSAASYLGCGDDLTIPLHLVPDFSAGVDLLHHLCAQG
jgi:hypothetical protein